MKGAIVLTTINVPNLLEGYARNFIKFEHLDVGFIVVGDRRTPHKECNKIVNHLKDEGFEAYYFDIASQERWLEDFPKLAKIIPYNSDNRRNIGFLIAAQYGAQTIISIDDDNYVTDDDFYGYHSIVGTLQSSKTVYSSNGFFNPCSLLRFSNERMIYPRGFPFSKRWNDKVKFVTDSGHIVLNLGLWTGVPDADAVTHLNGPITSLGLNSNVDRVMLVPRVFSPINTQNTAFQRSILPCYYYVLMGLQVEGLVLDRYGDIWSGYFAKKVIDKVGDRVSIGRPLTDHRRNLHYLFNDLKAELLGMILTEKIVEFLETCNLDNKTCKDAYLELADKLSTAPIDDKPVITRYMKRITNAMRIWVESCDKVL
ncbi:MAG: hypothetical protein ACE5I5_14215 [Candidatus Heimdallarchaeota archaeon]